MLTSEVLEQILTGIPRLCVGVLGDLFLDRYLDVDAALTESSIETGLDAYQVVRVRASPGAAGTVLNNLVALGVGAVHPLAMIGDDGEGYELRQALALLPGVHIDGLCLSAERRTPTYTKPMLTAPGAAPRELNRLDIKNRQPLPASVEQLLLHHLEQVWPRLDALLVLDQVSEADCGVVTARLRERLAKLGATTPGRLILADSRERIGMFRRCWLKPNAAECRRAVAGAELTDAALLELARRVGRPVFCTHGAEGMSVADPHADSVARVPAYRVSGPIDTVGAGDSSSAALACALGLGMSTTVAAAFANLVASITIGQIGTTGTASPHQVRERWREVEAANC